MGGAVRVGVWTLHIHRMESDRLHMPSEVVAVGGKHAPAPSQMLLCFDSSQKPRSSSTAAGEALVC